MPLFSADARTIGSVADRARPKALLRDGDRSLIAKFSSTTDVYPVVEAEGAAMALAQRCGLDVAPTEVVAVSPPPTCTTSIAAKRSISSSAR